MPSNKSALVSFVFLDSMGYFLQRKKLLILTDVPNWGDTIFCMNVARLHGMFGIRERSCITKRKKVLLYPTYNIYLDQYGNIR